MAMFCNLNDGVLGVGSGSPYAIGKCRAREYQTGLLRRFIFS
jgi:ATP-dependent protease HslVU (ClpYQ) peptidase subunit